MHKRCGAQFFSLNITEKTLSARRVKSNMTGKEEYNKFKHSSVSSVKSNIKEGKL